MSERSERTETCHATARKSGEFWHCAELRIPPTPAMPATPLDTHTQETRSMDTQRTRPVIVTTAHRGVFFGYATDTTGETITLERARLCVYWSADVRGFMGLASGGPTTGCRIGPPADITLRAITAVVEVAPEAVEAWEAAPWR